MEYEKEIQAYRDDAIKMNEEKNKIQGLREKGQLSNPFEKIQDLKNFMEQKKKMLLTNQENAVEDDNGFVVDQYL